MYAAKLFWNETMNDETLTANQLDEIARLTADPLLDDVTYAIEARLTSVPSGF